MARIDDSMIEDFYTFKTNINKILDQLMEERKYILDNYEEKCGIIEQNKIFNTEDKFIHVKYIMGIC